MNVLLTMTKDEAQAALDAYRAAEKTAVEWLTSIRANISILQRALGPSAYKMVPSASDYAKVYKVERDDSGSTTKYTCTCYSFTYQNGTDLDGRCKHIRSAIQTVGGWKYAGA